MLQLFNTLYHTKRKHNKNNINREKSIDFVFVDFVFVCLCLTNMVQYNCIYVLTTCLLLVLACSSSSTNVLCDGFATVRLQPSLLLQSKSKSNSISLTNNMIFPSYYNHDTRTHQFPTTSSLLLYRGGAKAKDVTKTTSTKTTNTNTNTQLLMSSTFNTGTKCPMTGTATILSSLWGTGGVIYILIKAIKRVLPIALEPFQKSSSGYIPLTQFQLLAYIGTVLMFAYVEGYKGFQTKFSPLVVKRSFSLVPGKNGTKWYHFILAPMYSMGLIHATKKRQIISWSVTIGVAAIVGAVKRLPYPYRNIIDAGVVSGLSWGCISILLIYINSWFTGTPPPKTNPELP